MSLRIHELAKRHNMEGKDMLALLKERGYVSADTKSVSSTVANIYIEEIEKELAAKAAANAPAPEAPSAEPALVPEDPASEEAPKLRLPPGAFVKSKPDVEREKGRHRERKDDCLGPQERHAYTSHSVANDADYQLPNTARCGHRPRPWPHECSRATR